MKKIYKLITFVLLLFFAFVCFQNYEENRYAYSTVIEVNQLEAELKEIIFLYEGSEVTVVEDESYYLDGDGRQIPTSTKYTARTIVATGDIGIYNESYLDL